MPKMIRARNDGKIAQTVMVDGNYLRVVPGGTVLLKEGSPFLGVEGFTAIGSEVVPGRSSTVAAAPNEVDALKAQLAELAALVAKLSAPANVEYPVNLGGGKWRLSDGTETKGGTSKVDAQAMESALHESQ